MPEGPESHHKVRACICDSGYCDVGAGPRFIGTVPLSRIRSACRIVDTVRGASSRRLIHGKHHHGPPAGGDCRSDGDRRRRQLSHSQLPARRRSRGADHCGPDGRGVGHRTPARDSRHRQEHGRQSAGHRRQPALFRCATNCSPSTAPACWSCSNCPAWDRRPSPCFGPPRKITSIDQLAQAIEEGRLAGLPRMGAKQIEKLTQGHRGLSAQRRPVPHRRGRRGRRQASRLICWPSTESNA